MDKQKICPKCGDPNGYFKEWTHELCSQGGIVIKADGKVDYDSADTIDITGEMIRVISYQCEACLSEFELTNGKLRTMGR